MQIEWGRQVVAGLQEQPSQPPSTLRSGIFAGAGSITVDATVLPVKEPAKGEIIARLDAIDAQLREIKPLIERISAERPTGVGHNNPPEEIDALPVDAADLELVAATVAAARVEIKSEQPRAEILELCRLALQRVSLRLALWIPTKLDRFVDAFMIAAGREAGTDLMRALVDKLPQFHEDLMQLLNSLLSLFS
jgi:hypothetical protein